MSGTATNCCLRISWYLV